MNCEKLLLNFLMIILQWYLTQNNATNGEGPKILTPKQMLKKLPTDNNSENLLNNQTNSLYQSN